MKRKLNESSGLPTPSDVESSKMRRVSLVDLSAATTTTLTDADPFVVAAPPCADTNNSRDHPTRTPARSLPLRVSMIDAAASVVVEHHQQLLEDNNDTSPIVDNHSSSSTSSSSVSSSSLSPPSPPLNKALATTESSGIMAPRHHHLEAEASSSYGWWEEPNDDILCGTKPRPRSFSWLLLVFGCLTVLLVTSSTDLRQGWETVLTTFPLTASTSHGNTTITTRSIEPHSICVSGGGFSGFWFTLGRLESVSSDVHERSNWYCYSAGCLGVVARMQRWSLHELRDLAYRSQHLWKTGTITRYQVVEHFVDHLLLGMGEDEESDTTGSAGLWFARLNVLTTTTTAAGQPRTSIRTPTSRQQLRTLLIQSAWIPLATGRELWLYGHMDGAFSLPQHPVCEKHVGLIADWDLLANVVNVNLGLPAVERLFQRGLAYGV